VYGWEDGYMNTKLNGSVQRASWLPFTIVASDANVVEGGGKTCATTAGAHTHRLVKEQDHRSILEKLVVADRIKEG